MKKLNSIVLISALFMGSYGFAQNSNLDSREQQDQEPRTVEWPQAYSKSASMVNLETDSNFEGRAVEINTNYSEKAYFGSYGEPRPEGTNNFGESLIYTNGPIVDTQDEPNLSILQDNLGQSLFGFGIQKNLMNSIADDFTLTEDFDITTMDFFVYQTGESAVSISAVYVQIWDGDPSAGGNVIWGDLSTNVMDNAALTNIHRVLESNQTDESRKIQRVTANTSGLSLTAGTYYVQTSMEGAGSSGPWLPPITVVGETYTGDALQYTGSSNDWQPGIDEGTGDPQGMPFEIYGILSASADDCADINPHYDWVFELGWTVSNGYSVANDIKVDAGTNFTLETITVPLGSEWPIINLNVVYYEDDGGKPGNQIGFESSPTISNITTIGNYLSFPNLNVYRAEIEVTPFQFEGQDSNDITYWIAIEDVDNGHNSDSYWSATSGNIVGNELWQLDEFTGDWGKVDGWDGNYTFKGECNDILGVQSNQMATLEVFPNPASDIIYLRAETSIGEVSLYNLLGQKVMDTKVDSNAAELNISHLSRGSYILKNDNGNQSQSYKIIKK